MSRSKKQKMKTTEKSIEKQAPKVPHGAIAGAPQRIQISTSYSSPFPPPEHARGLEEILPGAAERMMSMAETAQKHEMGMEKAQIGLSYSGLLAVVFITLVGMCGGGFLVMNNHEVGGFGIIGVSALPPIWGALRWIYRKI